MLDPRDGGLAAAGGLELLAAGTVVARYRIVAPLGRGGMGAVYVAEDTRLGRRVALKLVAPAAWLGGPHADEAKARLLREARAAAALEHPNVVAVYDVGEHEGAAYLAMELVAGTTLRERLAEPATLDEKVRWLADIADALAAAHAKGIVHRDIKPENVIIKPDGRAKVLDFGIARRSIVAVDPHAATAAAGSVDPRAATAVDGELLTLTARGAVIGTPHYMSPEQVRGEELDGRSDQFAWGVVAYEVVMGAVPWPTTNAVALIAHVLGTPPPPLDDRAPDELAIVIERALAKSPDERFASMEEVLEALGARAPAPALRAASLRPAGPPGALPASRSPARRWPLIAAALASLFAAAGVSVAVVGSAPTTPSAVAPEHRPVASANAAAQRSVALTDLPLPRSSSREALAAYQSGMQALRDGAMNSSLRSFNHARELDPAMSAAVFRGVNWFSSSQGVLEERELLRLALERRTDLPEHEALLLDALAPCAQRRDDDDRHCIRRLTKLARRFPRDAEYAWSLGAHDNVAGRMAASRDELRRALALDPKFYGAAAWLGDALWYLGEFDEARRAFGACAVEAPSPECALGAARLAQQEGRVDEAERSARVALEIDGSNWSALSVLLDASAVQGQPESSLRAIAERRVALVPEARRWSERAFDDYDFAWRRGDFVATRRALDAARPAFDERTDVASHALVATCQVLLAEETGDLDAGADAARAYFDRFGSLVGSLSDGDGALSHEGFGYPLRALRRAGKLSREALRAERDRWVAKWEPRLGPDYRPFLWLEAYAKTTLDADDAREALDALPRFNGLPRRFDFMPGQYAIGRMYLLLDRADDALPFLEAAARQTLGFSPFPVWATLMLGEAREKNGETADACAAYARVLERWGHAKPRSVTADEATRRSRALHCPSRPATRRDIPP